MVEREDRVDEKKRCDLGGIFGELIGMWRKAVKNLIFRTLELGVAAH